MLTTDSAGPRLSQRLIVDEKPWSSPGGYPIYYCRRLLGTSVSLELLGRLVAKIHWADVVHLTSVYSFPTIPTLALCRILGKPVVWSPRGQLQRWKKSRKVRLKGLWERICNTLLAPRATVLHCTTREEADESHPRFPRARPVVVPNGVEIPKMIPDRVWRPDGTLRLLYLGRLDPKKGIENLLQAMTEVAENVNLTVCGTGDAVYANKLALLAHTLGLQARVRFVGHVEGDAKSLALWETDLCVIPSYTENFAMVVAEALAHGVPVIASKGTPWEELEKHGCGLWVENDPRVLAKAIEVMRARSAADLAAMGARGRAWMTEQYAWSEVANRMLAVYAKLVEDGRCHIR